MTLVRQHSSVWSGSIAVQGALSKHSKNSTQPIENRMIFIGIT